MRESITIDARAEQLYTFWRQLVRLPEVMPHLERVDLIDNKLSRWTAKAFGQVPLTWQAEMINEVPFETIGWRTLPGEAIQHAGSVVFREPAGQPAPTCACTCSTRRRADAAAWFVAMLGEDPAKLTRDGLQALKNRCARREP